MAISPIEKSDEEIVKLVQDGDSEQFGVLVERYQAKLLRYGHKFLRAREDIQDIVQDAFISAYRNIKSFDLSQRFSPWIYRIAHNAFANALRKSSRNPLFFIDFDTLLSHPVYEDPEPREKEREEIKKYIDKTLEGLKPNYREVLILHYLEELPYKEIAEILQVPVGTIGVRIKRAKDALKKAYLTQNPSHESL
ncbi:MAG: RNA polymerase sigma factor [Patescibacteria group bacterium]